MSKTKSEESSKNDKSPAQQWSNFSLRLIQTSEHFIDFLWKVIICFTKHKVMLRRKKKKSTVQNELREFVLAPLWLNTHSKWQMKNLICWQLFSWIEDVFISSVGVCTSDIKFKFFLSSRRNIDHNLASYFSWLTSCTIKTNQAVFTFDCCQIIFTLVTTIHYSYFFPTFTLYL